VPSNPGEKHRKETPNLDFASDEYFNRYLIPRPENTFAGVKNCMEDTCVTWVHPIHAIQSPGPVSEPGPESIFTHAHSVGVNPINC
jgi:hypothetical protein